MNRRALLAASPLLIPAALSHPAAAQTATAAPMGITPIYAPLAPSDATSAIQTALNSGPGTYMLPPGSYKVSLITVPRCVTLAGAGRYATIINGNVTVPDKAGDWGIRDLCITGSQSSGTNTLTIGVGASGGMCSRVQVIYGENAIFNQGGDNYFDDVIACYGTQCNLISSGANWYNRCKFDGDGSVWAYARLDTGDGGAEETFNMCDFSGKFEGGAVYINDAYNEAAVKFIGCCIGGFTQILGATYCIFSACSLGNISNTGPCRLIVSGCYP